MLPCMCLIMKTSTNINYNAIYYTTLAILVSMSHRCNILARPQRTNQIQAMNTWVQILWCGHEPLTNQHAGRSGAAIQARSDVAANATSSLYPESKSKLLESVAASTLVLPEPVSVRRLWIEASTLSVGRYIACEWLQPPRQLRRPNTAVGAALHYNVCVDVHGELYPESKVETSRARHSPTVHAASAVCCRGQFRFAGYE